MYKKLICVFMVLISCFCTDILIMEEDTQLLLAFMTHRHGDRTPVKDMIQFAFDTERVVERTLEYGYGQLTTKGYQTSYELGRFIRRRYGDYLSTRYNKSEIHIRSTDSTRAKMTVLAAMAAVYRPTEHRWNNEIHWTPVPYTTLPAKYDHMLSSVNCPAVINGTRQNLQKPVLEMMVKYKTLLEEVSDALAIDITKMPLALFIIYDIFISQINLGVPLSPFFEHLLPEIKEAANEAFDKVFGDESYLALEAGVLLKEFFDAADNVIAGKSIQKIQIHSAHDINVYALSAVSKVTPRIGVPKYASLFSLELRRDLATGQYIIVPVYLEEPGKKEIYVPIEGCEGFCDLETFRQLTAEYVRTEKDWRSECGFSEDYDFDMSLID